VLDRLKEDMNTRHIPVQIISTEEERERGLRMGAVGVLTKPVRTKETLDETFEHLKDPPATAHAQRAGRRGRRCSPH
jgi:CheY-like chemotaxis protein